MSAPITLRPCHPADESFLYRVYASTREEELAIVPWQVGQKEAFLQMQFHAQSKFYHEQFPDTAFDVILRDGEPIGRLYVDRRPDEICIIDIALLPEHRRAGIGGALLRGLLAEADKSGKPVRIHVEHHNPALSLYKRLGFVAIEDTGVYCLMERLPRESAQNSIPR